ISTLQTDRPQSKKAFTELQEYIPGGVNSPVRAFRDLKITPVVAERAFRDTIVDQDGNEYIDFCMSWGPLICGHAHPQIVQAVTERLKKGTSFGCTTELEGKLAKKIRKHMPTCERIRFVSSGTEATMSAARLARGYTGKPLIVKFSGNYHGHNDSFLVQAGSGVLGLTPTSTSAGIPQEFLKWTACLPYNDVEALDRFLSVPENAKNLAAIIVEPIACNMGVVPGTHEFLQHIRKKTKELSALCIFDEVVTGFRLGLGGAQKYFGIEVDITCLGKIIGGGFPCAAFAGKKEIMEKLAPLGPVYQAGTLSGNPVAVEAGYQTLCLVEEKGFYEMLQKKMDLFLTPIESFIEKEGINACLQRQASTFTLFFGKKSVKNME